MYLPFKSTVELDDRIFCSWPSNPI